MSWYRRVASEVRDIGTTYWVHVSQFKLMGHNVNVWDCGGQRSMIMRYLDDKKQWMFSGVSLMVYVFDCVQPVQPDQVTVFHLMVRALEKFSPSTKVVVLYHKTDLLDEHVREQRIGLFQNWMRDIVEPKDIDVYGTSIWDHTLYYAWSNIMKNLVPRLNEFAPRLQAFVRKYDLSRMRTLLACFSYVFLPCADGVQLCIMSYRIFEHIVVIAGLTLVPTGTSAYC